MDKSIWIVNICIKRFKKKIFCLNFHLKPYIVNYMLYSLVDFVFINHFILLKMTQTFEILYTFCLPLKSYSKYAAFWFLLWPSKMCLGGLIICLHMKISCLKMDIRSLMNQINFEKINITYYYSTKTHAL